MTADSAVVVISPKAGGVQLTKTPTSNHGDEYSVTFTDAEVDAVLDGAQPHRVNQLALAAIGAFASGLVAGALRLTADYVATASSSASRCRRSRPWPHSSRRFTSPLAQ